MGRVNGATDSMAVRNMQGDLMDEDKKALRKQG
jgi:hypothetical protein